MMRLLVAILVMLALNGSALGAVELALVGQPPVTIREVYHRNGVAFVALADVLPVLGLSGKWDSVTHLYHIRTARGEAVISPGSQFLRLGDRFRPLSNPPRFIDGKLRVDEDFVALQLPALLDGPVYFRNLDPGAMEDEPGGSPIDRLFAFLLRKEKPVDAPVLRGVAIDPGHGGGDPGVIASSGLKEKEVVLDVARRLEKQLKMQLGIPVYLTRDSDYTVSRAKRLAVIDRPDVDALVLLHAQGSLSAAPRGTTLFVRPVDQQPASGVSGGLGESMRLALHLSAALKEAGIAVNGIERAPLLPLGRGNLPSVLVELGYLSNASDLALLQDAAIKEKLAEGLYRGLKAFAEEQKEVGG
jgi:N-acetylmuramoyl-L-alanine amidase